MSIDQKTYKEKVERSFNEYRKSLGNLRVKTEAVARRGGETIALDKYGKPRRFFSSKTRFFELCIEGRGNAYKLITGPQDGGWFLYIPAMYVLCVVPDSEDYFHIKYQLNKAMGATDALTIAEGVCSYAKELRTRKHEPGCIGT